MIETTKEICKICGKEYDDSHIVPRAPYAPYWCNPCEEQINSITGGWVNAIFAASKEKADEV